MRKFIYLVVALLLFASCDRTEITPDMGIIASPANSFYFPNEETPVPHKDNTSIEGTWCYKHEFGGKFAFQLLSDAGALSATLTLKNAVTNIAYAGSISAVQAGNVVIDGTTYRAWDCEGTLNAATFTSLSIEDKVYWSFTDGTNTVESEPFGFIPTGCSDKYVKIEYKDEGDGIAYGVDYVNGLIQQLYVPVTKYALIDLDSEFETLIDQSSGQASLQFSTHFDEYEMITGEMPPWFYRKLKYTVGHSYLEIENIPVVLLSQMQAQSIDPNLAMLRGTGQFLQKSNNFGLFSNC